MGDGETGEEILPSGANLSDCRRDGEGESGLREGNSSCNDSLGSVVAMGRELEVGGSLCARSMCPSAGRSPVPRREYLPLRVSIFGFSRASTIATRSSTMLRDRRSSIP
jgi:hypothetical protein